MTAHFRDAVAELPLFAKADQSAAARLEPRFYALLEHNASWMRSRRLCDIMGTNERVLRQIADRSQGRVISGQQGYKLTRLATVEEIDHAERWLLSQARKMQERAVEIRKARNTGGRAA